MCSGLNHLLQALQHHIPYFRITVVSHCVLEGLQEVFLELEMRQFFFLQEARTQLSQGVQGEEGDVGVVMAANLERWIKSGKSRKCLG